MAENMDLQNINNCSFSNWYPHFKKLTSKSIIIPLPSEFIKYLLSDGVVLPKSCDNIVATNRYDSDDEDNIWNTNDSDEEFEEAVAPSFPEFEDQIKKAIEELGGMAFPKLNWSAPKDAVWIKSPNNLKCHTISDLFLLLKSSDFICHDLTDPYKHCIIEGETPKVDYSLVLRKWVEIEPSTEFRCFVYDNRLIGICQRDHTNYYEYIKAQEQSIVIDIVSFFKEHLKEKFTESQYVFDVYRKRKDYVKLIDFNPYGEVTDSLMFEWKELKAGSELTNLETPEFRYNKERLGVTLDPYRYSRVPQDYLNLAQNHQFNLEDFLNIAESTNN